MFNIAVISDVRFLGEKKREIKKEAEYQPIAVFASQ
jgi:hypothetical protein